MNPKVERLIGVILSPRPDKPGPKLAWVKRHDIDGDALFAWSFGEKIISDYGLDVELGIKKDKLGQLPLRSYMAQSVFRTLLNALEADKDEKDAGKIRQLSTELVQETKEVLVKDLPEAERARARNIELAVHLFWVLARNPQTKDRVLDGPNTKGWDYWRSIYSVTSA